MTDQFDDMEFVEEEEDLEVEEELEDEFDEEFEIVDNFLEGDERTVTIRTSGASVSVPWEEGITLQEAFDQTDLVLRTRADFYLDNNTIEMETVLPAGAVVTAIGATQKGG
jgi:hypothetical protein